MNHHCDACTTSQTSTLAFLGVVSRRGQYKLRIYSTHVLMALITHLETKEVGFSPLLTFFMTLFSCDDA